MAGRGLLLSVFCLIGLAYWLNTPLPEDCVSHWAVQTEWFGVWKLMGPLFQLSETLGLMSRPHLSRKVYNWYGYYKAWVTGIDDGKVNVTDLEVEGVGVRLYQPVTQKAGLLPGMVFFHAGGWVIGSPQTDHVATSRFARETPIIVMSVDYRMAPEVKFPIPYEDCLKVAKHFLKNAEKYGADPDRVTLAGASAGGNLAAAVSAELADIDFKPRNKVQVLVYPCLQAVDTNTPSYQQVPFEFLMSRESMAWFWSMYATGKPDLTLVIAQGNHTSPDIKKEMAASLLDHSTLPEKLLFPPYTKVTDLDHGDLQVWEDIKDTVLHPRFSPLLAKEVANLPTTYMWSVKYDVLRDEAFWYVERLRKAGVKVKQHYTTSAMHGIILFSMDVPEGDEGIRNIVKFLQENL